MLSVSKESGQVVRLQPLSLSPTALADRPELRDALLGSPAKLLEELGEELFLLGTHVPIGDTFDRTVDLLALDRLGNMVIVMIQQGVGESPLAPALILAAEISSWKADDIKDRLSDSEIDALQNHLNVRLDETNRQQRLILISDQYVSDLVRVTEWLNSRGTDISYVRLSAMVDSQSATSYLLCSHHPDSAETGDEVILRASDNGTEVLIRAANQGHEQLNERIEREITRRTRAETTLRASEERYQLLTKMSPVGVFHTDSAGNYLYVNQRWCEISGQLRERSLRQGWVKTIHPEDREELLEKWAESIKTGSPFRAEYRFSLPTGEVSWVAGHAEFLKDSTGKVKGLLGTVTALHRTETLTKVS